jgi:hypothetical protein
MRNWSNVIASAAKQSTLAFFLPHGLLRRGVNLPDPLQDARRRDHEAGFKHRATVNKRRRIARDENRNLGGVAESIIADREPGQEIGRYVIDEDQLQRKSPEQVEPQFSFVRGK